MRWLVSETLGLDCWAMILLIDRETFTVVYSKDVPHRFLLVRQAGRIFESCERGP
jgi:hypothetical protein